MVQQTVRAFLLLSVLAEFGTAFLAATYVTFLLGHRLDYFQVNLTNLVFFVTMVVCEVPTGAIADVLGRRVSFVASCSLLAVSMLLYAGATTMGGFALAEAVGAVGATCRSGAFQAWVVDQLRHHQYAGSLTPVFARCAVFEKGATLIGALLGPFLYRINPALPWRVGGAFFVLTGIVAIIVMREDYFVRQATSLRSAWGSMRSTAASSLAFGFRVEPVRFVFGLTLVQALACQAPNMQWQPLFTAQLPSVIWLGPVFAGIVIASSVGAALAPRLLRRIGCERLLLLGTQVVIGLGIAAAGLGSTLGLCVSAFLLHECARGGFCPVKDAFLNDHIPSTERATVLSCEAIAHHIGGAVGLVSSGLLASRLSLPIAWLASGLILVGWSFVGIRRRRPRRSASP